MLFLRLISVFFINCAVCGAQLSSKVVHTISDQVSIFRLNDDECWLYDDLFGSIYVIEIQALKISANPLDLKILSSKNDSSFFGNQNPEISNILNPRFYGFASRFEKDSLFVVIRESEFSLEEKRISFVYKFVDSELASVDFPFSSCVLPALDSAYFIVPTKSHFLSSNSAIFSIHKSGKDVLSKTLFVSCTWSEDQCTCIPIDNFEIPNDFFVKTAYSLANCAISYPVLYMEGYPLFHVHTSDLTYDFDMNLREKFGIKEASLLNFYFIDVAYTKSDTDETISTLFTTAGNYDNVWYVDFNLGDGKLSNLTSIAIPDGFNPATFHFQKNHNSIAIFNYDLTRVHRFEL